VALSLVFSGYDTAYAYTTSPLATTYDGTYFYYSCTDPFVKPNQNHYLVGIATSTYPLYFGVSGGALVGSSCLTIYPSGIINFGLTGIIGQPAGTYYAFNSFYDDNITNPNTADYSYTEFYWNGSIITNYTSTTTPQIYSLTYSTTTATANVIGYWEATTTPYLSQKLSFWQFSSILGVESYEQITATTTGYFNYSFSFLDPLSWTTGATTTAPIYNSFTLNASLDLYNETDYIFGQLPPPNYITYLDATSTTISAVDNYNASDFTSNPRSLALYPEYECGITSLTGCFKNAIIWAFYPTQETLDNWTSLLTTIQSKAPVGYFYMARDNVGGLSATSTKAFSVAIPSSLKTYVFNPFDTAIAAILWFFFIFNFYKRLKIITI
jgi:hypothetical protein